MRASRGPADSAGGGDNAIEGGRRVSRASISRGSDLRCVETGESLGAGGDGGVAAVADSGFDGAAGTSVRALRLVVPTSDACELNAGVWGLRRVVGASRIRDFGTVTAAVPEVAG